MDEKTSIILSQWQTCVEMANNISQRRDSMNSLMVTVNLALIAAISITWDPKSLIICIAGIISSAVWLWFISIFKKLNKAKYDVIIKLEEKLPEQPFKQEWESLKKYKRYKNLTWLEKIMPIVFMGIHFLLFISLLRVC